MENIWIIGVGQFGRLAYERLSDGHSHRRFVLVDSDDRNLERVQGSGNERHHADGVDFLLRRLGTDERPDWIVPALPVHLAAEWCLKRLGPDRIERTAIPDDVAAALPNALRGPGGDVYVSHATFKCPDDCAEPAGYCTVTGKPRPRNMFEVLADLQTPPFRPVVLRSRQLGPGIGGYRPAQLEAFCEAAEQVAGPLLLCTACRCHGVATGVRRRPR